LGAGRRRRRYGAVFSVGTQKKRKKKRVRPAFISRIDKKSVSIWWMERCRGRVGVAGPAAALIYESKAWQRDRGGWRGAGGDLFCAEDHHLRAKRGAQRKKAWGSLFRFFPMQKETLIKEKAGKKQFQQTHSGYLVARERDIHPFQSSRTEMAQCYVLVTPGRALAPPVTTRQIHVITS
jgi:hypothetical protein